MCLASRWPALLTCSGALALRHSGACALWGVVTAGQGREGLGRPLGRGEAPQPPPLRLRRGWGVSWGRARKRHASTWIDTLTMVTHNGLHSVIHTYPQPHPDTTGHPHTQHGQRQDLTYMGTQHNLHWVTHNSQQALKPTATPRHHTHDVTHAGTQQGRQCLVAHTATQILSTRRHKHCSQNGHNNL